MSVQADYNQAEDKLTIRISGQFNYGVHQDFSNAYKELMPSDRRKYVIDLSSVEHIDSSALGMLLLLKERAGGSRADITLQGGSSAIKKILDISGFKHLFKVI